LLVLVVTLVLTGGCETTDDIVTSTGTLRVSVVDRDLASQFEAFTDPSDPPGWQAMFWEVQSADLTIPTVEPGTFSYVLKTPPCEHLQLGPAEIDILDCGLVQGFFGEGVGYAMDPAAPIEVSMRLVVNEMDIRRADRPLLLPELDQDGDLVLNEIDNCVLIPNPDQEDLNGDGFGDACSLRDFNGDATIPDRDGDRVADSADNCVWIANADQADTTVDGIGDACEHVAEVILASPELELGPITVTIEGQTWNYVSADFNDELALPGCEPTSTSCTLDPRAVLLTSP
jgi:hypothetical protein